MKIVFIHSLNNFSGSPNILSTVIRGMIGKGYDALLITSRGKGFLSDITGLKYRYTCYRWLENRAATFALLMLSQAGLFFRILFSSRRNLYYINTIVPFGAILACRLTGKRFIIHVHENMQQDKVMYRIFRRVYSMCNTKSIFVSDYLQSKAVNCRQGAVIPNALTCDFCNRANEFINSGENAKRPNATGDIIGKSDDHESASTIDGTILMISSLRRFKGVYEFAELAKAMPGHRFELILSASPDQTQEFAREVDAPENLKVFSQQQDVHPFYRKAKILLQLSHPKECVETFGLTILEAMAYGIPAIVPNVGGPAELVTDGVNGFTVDPLDHDELKRKTEILMNSTELYSRMSSEALSKAKQYDEKKMLETLENYIV